MTTVEFSVMEPLKLKLRNLDGYVRAIDVDKEKCQWNLVKNLVFEGPSLKHWAVVVFNCPNSSKEVDLVMLFVQNLIRRCKTLGLHMEDPLSTIWASMDELESADSVTSVLEQVQREAHETNESNLQLVLCVMAHKHTGHRNIKWVSETKIGVLTQCCLFDMAKRGQDQYLANLGIKINAKLGGSTVELNDQPSLFDEAADHVMLIGADVNHPPPSDSSSKSVAFVVASMNWQAANKYISRISYQKNRLEEIKMFGSICLELIKCYENISRVKPNKLVTFRDGVSEGQFDMAFNKELLDLKDELRKIDNYHPTITLIVAQKRHLTRLFRAAQGDDENNIRLGTVVDTDIVHPSQFDFYLRSHYGSMGTSKPTYYHLLWDDHKFSPEKLQQFIYHLCFTFAKCSKPVSLVPPIYYANRLAFRGQLYCDAQRPLGESPSDRNPAHSDIKNFMYFI
uniref:Piwi domain-containing protein n=2 Tax=Chenopodium quinoa TaxID=63459 RepID=A0A803N6F1_CHEQI